MDGLVLYQDRFHKFRQHIIDLRGPFRFNLPVESRMGIYREDFNELVDFCFTFKFREIFNDPIQKRVNGYIFRREDEISEDTYYITYHNWRQPKVAELVCELLRSSSHKNPEVFETDENARRQREVIWAMIDLFGLKGHSLPTSEKVFLYKIYRRDMRLEEWEDTNLSQGILHPKTYSMFKDLFPKRKYTRSVKPDPDVNSTACTTRVDVQLKKRKPEKLKLKKITRWYKQPGKEAALANLKTLNLMAQRSRREGND